jgi:ABC-type sugar transport system substrate-binding protein
MVASVPGPASALRSSASEREEHVNLRTYLSGRIRYFVVFALICVVSVALAACGSGSSSSSSSESTGSPESTAASSESTIASSESSGVEGLKVGFFIGSASVNIYSTVAKEATEETAERLGVDLTVVDANLDVENQIHQMQLAEQRGSFEAWIVAVLSGTEECGQIKQAIASGIPVMVINSPICETEETLTGELGNIGFVGLQGEEAYDAWAQAILSENEPQELGLVIGPPGNTLTDETEEAFEKEGEAYPGFTTAIAHTDYTTEDAFQQTQAMLQAHPSIKLIASNYSGLTTGVLQAVRAAGLIGKVKIYDLLADKHMVQAIKNGEVYASIPGMPASEGEYGVEAVVKNAEGKSVPPTYNPMNSLEFEGKPLLTKKNVDEYTPQY